VLERRVDFTDRRLGIGTVLILNDWHEYLRMTQNDG